MDHHGSLENLVEGRKDQRSMVEGPRSGNPGLLSDCQDGGELHGGAEWCKTWQAQVLGAKAQISNAGSVPISYISLILYPMDLMDLMDIWWLVLNLHICFDLGIDLFSQISQMG